MKKYFMKKAPKDLTPEQQQELLEKAGAKSFAGSKKESKFGQFSNYAQQLASQNKTTYAPGQTSSSNPYAKGNASSNPYAQGNANQNPYGQGSQAGASPYGSGAGSGPSRPAAANPYAQAEEAYGSRFSNSAPEVSTQRPSRAALAAKAGGYGAAAGAAAAAGVTAASAQDELFDPPTKAGGDELFDPPVEFDTRSASAGGAYGYGEGQEATQMDSEDEEVERIKGEIKFTKQESVNSTRNTLRMAAEAEESGRNALGMLGAQGERLANTERSLALAENQNRVAAEKAKELKIANRPLYAPHISNPFTKNKRLAEEEARIKQQYMREQLEREKRRQVAWDSQQRVINGLQLSQSETAMKYKSKASGSEERKKYQFEEDSEDEEMENEIDTNLEAIHAASARLNRLAKSTGEEVERQNARLDEIADQTDRLDINVHLNTSRLANIK